MARCFCFFAARNPNYPTLLNKGVEIAEVRIDSPPSAEYVKEVERAVVHITTFMDEKRDALQKTADEKCGLSKKSTWAILTPFVASIASLITSFYEFGVAGTNKSKAKERCIAELAPTCDPSVLYPYPDADDDTEIDFLIDVCSSNFDFNTQQREDRCLFLSASMGNGGFGCNQAICAKNCNYTYDNVARVNAVGGILVGAAVVSAAFGVGFYCSKSVVKLDEVPLESVGKQPFATLFPEKPLQQKIAAWLRISESELAGLSANQVKMRLEKFLNSLRAASCVEAKASARPSR